MISSSGGEDYREGYYTAPADCVDEFSIYRDKIREVDAAAGAAAEEMAGRWRFPKP